jgi:uncharacterized protein (DUF302 family)
MTYTINRTLKGVSFKDINARTRAALADNGFGVLTEIDVQATMKKKLDVEMPAYRILGACNPKMAHEAIGIEPRVGAMLPCNVILREVDCGVEVSAVSPVASMQAIDDAELTAVADQVRETCWPRPSRRSVRLLKEAGYSSAVVNADPDPARPLQSGGVHTPPHMTMPSGVFSNAWGP